MRCNHAIFCRISIVLVLFLVSGMHALDVANYITETDNSLLWTFEQDGRQVIVLNCSTVRENPTRSMRL